MKGSVVVSLAIVALAAFVLLVMPGSIAVADPPPGVSVQAALGSGFAYQGFLKQGGSPVNGSNDIRFILYDSEVGGNQVGSTLERSAISVNGGLFTAALDFGAGAFDGQGRWLDIAVRPAGSVEYNTLSPRQALTPAPYALNATSAGTASAAPWSGLTGIPAGFADGTDNDSGGTITGVTAGTGLSGGGTSGAVALSVTGAPWSGLTGVPAGFSDGVDNDTDHTGTLWSTSGNAAGTSSNFLGTTDAFPFELRVGGARVLRLEPNDFSIPNLIAGVGNQASPGVIGATIGGGGGVGSIVNNGNLVSDYWGTIGGGNRNRAGDEAGTVDDANYATVGGGQFNNATRVHSTIGGGLSNNATGAAGTIGGGNANTASGNDSTVSGGISNTANSARATVAGGTGNNASGEGSSVAGGGPNTASGYFSAIGGGGLNSAAGRTAFVAGGELNTVDGDWSVAAGHRAKINAAHDGSFVFADSTEVDFNSSGPDTFSVRASDGARFVTSVNLISGAAVTGVTLGVGGGSWSSISDRNVKANFLALDAKDVLAKVAAMPISSWNLVTQDLSIRHMGPMAQDFYAAFGVGEDDLHINTVDADGVALAAIQGLNQVLEEKEARISRLEAQNSALEARLAALEAKLAGEEQ